MTIPAAQNGRAAILLVDDDDDFREVLRLRFESAGVAVYEAWDCESACSALEQPHDHLNVILVDYFMPGVAAVECVAELRRRSETSTPIVLVTAAADAAARAIAVGCPHWLSKPFTPDQLRRVLRAACGSDFGV